MRKYVLIAGFALLSFGFDWGWNAATENETVAPKATWGNQKETVTSVKDVKAVVKESGYAADTAELNTSEIPSASSTNAVDSSATAVKLPAGGDSANMVRATSTLKQLTGDPDGGSARLASLARVASAMAKSKQAPAE